MTEAARKTGRPAKAPGEKLEPVTIRLNAAQQLTLVAIGHEAVRAWLDKQGKSLTKNGKTPNDGIQPPRAAKEQR